MTTPAQTRITIDHFPRAQRITVERPGGEVPFRIEAPPTIALKALADWLRQWAERGQ